MVSYPWDEAPGFDSPYTEDDEMFQLLARTYSHHNPDISRQDANNR